MTKIRIKDLDFEELKKYVTEAGLPAFRAKQVFAWIYGGGNAMKPGGVSIYDEMNNVPKALRQKLEDETQLNLVNPVRVQKSVKDGTKKYLFELGDGNTIETVFMKYKYGNSICVSSQAGCAMGCTFCASAIGGLKRNLTAGEMVDQVLAVERDTQERISHIVVMGTGEPMNNYDNLAAFLRIMHDPQGHNMSMRNMTVSTCGVIPKIRQMAKDFPQVTLAISLHAADDETRSRIMPVNRKYPLAELLEATDEYGRETGRRVTYEYTLIKGRNDAKEDADKLINLLGGKLSHINLIPLNEVKETGMKGVTRNEAEQFRSYLESRGVSATVRRELGSDIDAACGQLRLGQKK